jgi:hypothetical protein
MSRDTYGFFQDTSSCWVYEALPYAHERAYPAHCRTRALS